MIEIGQKQHEPRPFEDATTDFREIRGKRFSNPSYGHEQHPGCIVNSCSECSMNMINGKPNMMGLLHRLRQTQVDRDGNRYLDCSTCQITKDIKILGAKDADGNPLYHKDGSRVTAFEQMISMTDGTK